MSGKRVGAKKYRLFRNGRVLLFAALLLVVAAFLGSKISWSERSTHYADPVGLLKFVQSALVDGAAAVLIAWVVSEGVERSYEKKLATIERQMLDTSSQNAARAVFGRFYGPQTIEEVFHSIFFSTLVRERLSAEYEFSRHEVSPNLIRLNCVIDYDVRNVSPVEALMPLKLMMPNLMAEFPGDPCSEPPEVRSIFINGRPLPDSQIADLNRSIDPRTKEVKVMVDKVPIPHGDKVSIRVELGLLKTIHDNEVMRTSYPSDKVTVQITNNFGDDLHIEISSIHRNTFGEKEYLNKSKSKWRWAIDGALLPSNGWVVHWHNVQRNPSA